MAEFPLEKIIVGGDTYKIASGGGSGFIVGQWTSSGPFQPINNITLEGKTWSDVKAGDIIKIKKGAAAFGSTDPVNLVDFSGLTIGGKHLIITYGHTDQSQGLTTTPKWITTSQDITVVVTSTDNNEIRMTIINHFIRGDGLFYITGDAVTAAKQLIKLYGTADDAAAGGDWFPFPYNASNQSVPADSYAHFYATNGLRIFILHYDDATKINTIDHFTADYAHHMIGCMVGDGTTSTSYRWVDTYYNPRTDRPANRGYYFVSSFDKTGNNIFLFCNDI